MGVNEGYWTRTRKPLGAFPFLIIFQMNSFAATHSILLRVQQQKRQKSALVPTENLPDRADLRDCGLFGQSPLAKTYSAGNHALTSKEAGPPTTLCCGHFFKR
jgi:hypothetical protein